jgi:hypothetical protein
VSAPLLEALERQSARLAEQVIDAMYRDAFWIERFGTRGQKHALEDANYHVSYLNQAMHAGDPALFTRYARWLQSVLVSRGMCSRHLDDSYAKLGQAIGQSVRDAAPALELLAAGRAALRYEAPLAGALQDDALAAELGDGESSAPFATASIPYALSYLSDALNADRPDWFENHIAWLGAFLPRHGMSAAELAAQLDRLERRLSTSSRVPRQLPDAIEPLLSRARVRLASA